MKKKLFWVKPSIRTYLLINLLLWVTLTTSLAIVGNLFLAHKDIQVQLDAQLIRTTLRLQAIFSGPVHEKNFAEIQQQIKQQNTYLDEFQTDHKPPSAAIEQASRNFEFQVWDAHGKLLLHSEYAVHTPFSTGAPGLSALSIAGYQWRVSTATNKNNHLTIMVAERDDYRQELENRLIKDSIVVMLITYPFLAFLIWMIVGRGLNTIKRVANEINQREPSYLEPVDLESVPTEVEPLIQELNSLLDRLHEAFEREKRFTADAAHELKTPLAALSAHAQVAMRARDEKEKKEALDKVLSGVKRSTHVVQQLLTLSRMEPDAGLSETVPLILAKEAAEVITMLVPNAMEKNIEIELLAPESKATVLGNITAIDILIRNLVDNAIRYSPENSTVTIDIQEHDQKVMLIVTDNGPGIPESLRKRVFERFFRVIGNNTMGSGLGLSIVQQIVRLHQAEIELHTPASGKGAEFRVIFNAYQL